VKRGCVHLCTEGLREEDEEGSMGKVMFGLSAGRIFDDVMMRTGKLSVLESKTFQEGTKSISGRILMRTGIKCERKSFFGMWTRVQKGSDQIGETVKKSQVIDDISWVSTATITDTWMIDKDSKVETGICVNQWLEHENLAGTKLGRLWAFLGTPSFC
jgi:hypothetical protein